MNFNKKRNSQTSKEVEVITSTDQFNSKEISLNRFEEFKQKIEYEFFENFTSEHTKKSYRVDINQFAQFILTSFPNISRPDEIERFHMVAYRNFLQSQKLAPKTINRKLSSISSYFDFLTEKNLMSFNPCKSIKRPRQEVLKETNDLSDDNVLKVLYSFDKNSPSYYLHRAVLFTLFSTGIRKAELISLKIKDYRVINGHKVIEVTAKGGKQLIKVVHPECAEMIEDYLNWMKNDGRSLGPDDWMFRPTRNPREKKQATQVLDKKLCPSSIDYMLKQACRRAGISDRISPHSARASYIGSALENGVDLWKISQDVGHASVRTTEIYNKRRQKIQDSPAYDLGFLKDKKKRPA